MENFAGLFMTPASFGYPKVLGTQHVMVIPSAGYVGPCFGTLEVQVDCQRGHMVMALSSITVPILSKQDVPRTQQAPGKRPGQPVSI